MAIQQETRPVSIDPRTQVGAVALNVANLERSLRFYTQALGFELLERRDAEVVLGAAGTPLLVLHEQPGAALDDRPDDRPVPLRDPGADPRRPRPLARALLHDRV